MSRIFLVVFLFITSNTYSQVEYKNYLYNLDSLITPKLFTFVNTKDNRKSYLIQKAIKIDTGYLLILKRFTDSFDIDSSIQFIDNKKSSSIYIKEFWFYENQEKESICCPDNLESSVIDYYKPNDHIYSVSFKPCDYSIPIKYWESAIFKKVTNIKIRGKIVKCLKYKTTGISTDFSKKKTKRKGFVYLGQNIGVIKYSNNSFFNRTSWILREIVSCK